MNRFRELRLRAGFPTQAELAKILYVNQTAVSQWERGVTTPSPQILVRLANMYGVSTDYLLGVEKPGTTGVRIPVLGDVAAGIPIEAITDILDYEEINAAMASTGDFFGLRIRGDSMEPRIQDGDVVIVRKQEDVTTGDTAVVLINGDSATVKKVKKEPDGGIRLVPNNPAYEVQYYTPKEMATLPVRILGKVVELRGKF